MKTVHIAYLSLGSNQGNRLKTLQQAVDLIDKEIGRVFKTSSIYKTKSWGFDGDDFYNICIEVSSKLPSDKILQTALKIEKILGRKRSDSNHYENRSIDIDILLFDDKVIFNDNLKVPHSKMLERKFVLSPLSEIAPSILHPIVKKTISNCLINCDDTSEIEKVKDSSIQPPSSII